MKNPGLRIGFRPEFPNRCVCPDGMFTWTKAVRSKYSLPDPMPPLISTVSLAQVRFNDVTYWLSLN